jgi:hypothetical protein
MFSFTITVNNANIAHETAADSSFDVQEYFILQPIFIVRDGSILIFSSVTVYLIPNHVKMTYLIEMHSVNEYQQYTLTLVFVCV